MGPDLVDARPENQVDLGDLAEVPADQRLDVDEDRPPRPFDVDEVSDGEVVYLDAPEDAEATTPDAPDAPADQAGVDDDVAFLDEEGR